MTHFVTLYPEAENVHLVKDVAQIPYQLHKHYSYRSTLVSWKNAASYPYLQTQTPGLTLKFIEKKPRRFFWSNAALGYLWKHAGSIDVLNLYFLNQESMLYGILYKMLNPNGVLYLKFDLSIPYFKRNRISFSKVAWKERVHQQLYRIFRRVIDVASAESDRAMDLIEELDPVIHKKTIKLPNGIDFSQLELPAPRALYEKKENIILTVGRVGAESKNSRFLLEALSEIDLKGWEVYFVGPIAPGFVSVISDFFSEHPALKSSIHFTGRIDNRQALMSYYKRAKIFCLPSRWEGFPLVLVEAQNFGNYIIGTDTVSSIDEMIDNNQFGREVPLGSKSALQAALQEAMDPQFYTQRLMEKIVAHGKTFNWTQIIKKLHCSLVNVD